MSSSDYRLNKMVEIFEQCLDEAEVFSRDVPNRSLIEWVEKREKDGSHWALLAAGIPQQTAEDYFKQDSDRADQATMPLKVAGGGSGVILLKMRPIEWPSSRPAPGHFIAHYSPADIALVEIAKGRISLDFDLPNGRIGLFNLRWEVDAREAGKPPLEDWLRGWWRTLGYNPAHPSSHLHFNSQSKGSSEARSWDSVEPPENDLRLAIGDTNPLAFLLSVAAWVRRNLDVQ